VCNKTQKEFRSGERTHHILAFAMVVTAAIIAFTPANARAQGIPPVVWSSHGSFQYDNGEAPSVAVSGLVIVEVHQGSPGTLWYHTGKIQENGTVSWASSAFQYDNGYAPSVTISGNEVVEVHQADTGTGPLWYHTGKINANGTVTWNSSAFQYDNGSLPSVAVSGQTIVEVHQGSPGALWYHTPKSRPMAQLRALPTRSNMTTECNLRWPWLVRQSSRYTRRVPALGRCTTTQPKFRQTGRCNGLQAAFGMTAARPRR
jgi:hypothetical protein